MSQPCHPNFRPLRLLCRFLGIFFILWLSSPAYTEEEMPISIVTLSYRSANAIIPLIKPVMPKGSTLVGDKNHLIIRTTPQNLAEITEMIKTLDRPPQVLAITVKQGAQTDQWQMRNPEKVRIIETRSHGGENDEQTVQVLDGEMAFIQTGKEIQILKAVDDVTSDTEHGIVAGIDYKKVQTGFYVLPQLQGDRVLLVISRNRDVLSRTGNGDIDTTQMETRTIIPLDTWTPLGGVSHAATNTQNVVTYSAGDIRQELSTIYVKVNKVSP